MWAPNSGYSRSFRAVRHSKLAPVHVSVCGQTSIHEQETCSRRSEAHTARAAAAKKTYEGISPLMTAIAKYDLTLLNIKGRSTSLLVQRDRLHIARLDLG